MQCIFGIQPVLEALRNDVPLEKVWMEKGHNPNTFRDVLILLKEKNIPYQWVPKEKIRKLAPGKNHQGLVAYTTSIRYYRTEEILPGIFEKGKIPFLIILDKITDVRNFGGIARTAECMGADALIVPMQGNAPVNEDSIRTSAGALLHIPVCREPKLKNTLSYLKESGVTLIAIHEKTNTSLDSLSLTGPLAIMLGNEESGISSEYLKYADQQACIPMHGKIASLNVSVAAAIAIYEVARQRNNQK
jgi:23S rRNA (guanosine2251-2'-O)-methyltransferase